VPAWWVLVLRVPWQCGGIALPGGGGRSLRGGEWKSKDGK